MIASFLKAWNNFKARPDIWFFYGFLLTFTLSIRKVFFFYPIMGGFNEYTGIYLYLSDILLILAILVWIFTILRNKKSSLSSYIQFFSRREAVILVLVLLTWALMSISWAGNTNLALFKALKLAEFSLLFLYIAYNALYKPIIRNTVGFIIALGFIQAIIGIIQAVLQHSVGLFWLKESLLSVNIDGVAEVVLFGHKFIRSYGLFPHPNIFGGFLLVSIILTYFYSKLFHVKQSGFFKVTIILRLVLIIQIIALFCTFSKSAIIGLLVTAVYIYFKFTRSDNLQLFHVKHFYKYLATFIIIFALFITILGFNIDSSLLKSFNERLLFLNVSRETIVGNPMVGLGMGQFVPEMQKYSPVFLANWQYQPVHNVFLLIWSELGIIGLVLFILFLWKVFHACPSEDCSTWNNQGRMEQFSDSWGETIAFKAILLGFIIIMLFDHYLWDIQQGQVMLWLMLGLVVGTKNSEK